MSGAVAAVQVVRAHHHARELLRGVIHLVRTLGATEEAEGLAAVSVFHGLEPGRRPLQRFVPRRLPKRAAAGITNERMDIRLIVWLR